MKTGAEIYRLGIVAVIVALVAANVLAALYVKDEKLPELAEMFETLRAQRTLLANKNTDLAELPKNREALAHFPARVIIPADELPRTAERLAGLLTESGMADTSFFIREREIAETDDGSEILNVRFQLAGTGDYESAAGFLQKVYDDADEYFFVNRVTLTMPDSGGGVVMSADISALFSEVAYE